MTRGNVGEIIFMEIILDAQYVGNVIIFVSQKLINLKFRVFVSYNILRTYYDGFIKILELL